jgi:predicted nucleic acid-binding protein
MQVILDTHVWLDCLVFKDGRHGALRDWLDGGPQAPVVLATEAMLNEFSQVIRRSRFLLTPDQADRLSAAQRARVRLQPSAPDCRLPCTDPDDQCFIDLAVAHRVDALLSRDKALLRLAKHARRRFGVRVMTPEAFMAAPAGTAPACL